MSRTLVLDVAALIRFSGSEDECYTTPEVVGELRDPMRQTVVQTKRDAGELHVLDPDPEFVREAEELARETGDLGVLSKADISLFALGLQLGEEAVLVTDDFALQNICSVRGIASERIVGRDIKDVVVWVTVCPVCGSRFENRELDVCPECGSKLTRKAIRKRKKG